jgi:HEAT repeat protein
MRVHNPQSAEYSACRRLLSTLGANTIGPLLEVLADEPDMAARKALVDLVSDMASKQIESLGARLSDPRWYFVRNVVNILGSTRDPAALAHLSRTLRHADARVRRETIRAVGGVRVKYAEDILVSALSDDDGQNVALAARTLGTLGVVEALQPLIEVAQGEGRGSRDVGARIEAIEALGRLGRREAVPVLRELERQRGLMRTGRVREIRTAAEAALAAIERSSGGGGA